jgi:hypothetical protein
LELWFPDSRSPNNRTNRAAQTTVSFLIQVGNGLMMGRMDWLTVLFGLLILGFAAFLVLVAATWD